MRPERKWKVAREKATYVKERESLVGYFSQRLRAIRECHVEPVQTYAEAYAVMDDIWKVSGLNRREPTPPRIAAFVSFISRMDYIARNGWYNRDWVGSKGNTSWYRKEKKDNANPGMGEDQALQDVGVRQPGSAGVGNPDEVGDGQPTGSDS
jgi:hypothetical protein